MWHIGPLVSMYMPGRNVEEYSHDEMSPIPAVDLRPSKETDGRMVFMDLL